MVAINDMPAERGIDALICEKVMGYSIRHGGMFGLERLMPEYTGKELQTLDGYESRYGNSYYIFEDGFNYAYGVVPYYSTDMTSAWEIVQKMSGKYRISVHDFSRDGTFWQCTFEVRDGTYRFPVEFAHQGDEYANAETPPLAICRCALKVAGIPSTELT